MTAEHAYQAAKFWRLRTWYIPLHLYLARSPYDAKMIAKKYDAKKRPDWSEELKIRAMEEIVWAKLQEHEYIQRKLLNTGDSMIVEDSPFDGFWGWGEKRDGFNHLGQIWMRHRDKLRGARPR